MKDGNGRVGRLLLAAQCADFGDIGLQEFLDLLRDSNPDYRRIFMTEEPAFQFELLVDLLSRLLAIPVGDVSLPLSIAPAYPERSRKPAATMTRKQA